MKHDNEKLIGFAQYEVQFGDMRANIDRVRRLLSNAGDVDLLVLPELAFSGYEFHDAAEVRALAEPAGQGPVSEFLRELSKNHNAVVVAGYAEAVGEKLYNSAMLVSGNKVLGNYRKIQLYSRENELFSPGDAAPQVYNTPAGRIGVMICFDWFFPEVARKLALAGAQVIAHPSNLVLPWCQRAMFARSVENHVFSITANRTGTEQRAGRTLTFTGGSQVLGPDGAVLAHADTVSDQVGLCAVDVASADEKQINPYNHLLESRRPEFYQL